MNADMLAAALDYAARGWPVFPLHHPVDGACSCGKVCDSIAKHPRTDHGLDDASTDVAQLTAWWKRWPLANIGIRTGIAFDVLDVDRLDPWEATANVWPPVDMPGGPVASTGKGWHFYLTPTGLGNKTLIAGASCDFRGQGGYVVAPPSLHASGRRYTWHSPADLTLHTAPAALLALLDPPRAQRPPATATSTTDAHGWTARGLVDRLTTSVDGERNNVLNWAAHKVGMDVWAGKATSAQARDALGQLYDVAVGVGLAEREIEATIKSGFGKGAQGVAA